MRNREDCVEQQSFKEYPEWVCYECGMKHGRRAPGVAAWHSDKCDVCDQQKDVTEPRDFGHLKDTWKNDK